MKKKFLSLFIICTLLATYFAMPSQANIALLEADGVIAAELSSVMATAGATDKIPVSIWTTEIDTEVVEAIALEKTGLNRDKIRELSANGDTEQLTSEAIDAYIAAEREIYKRLQTQVHQAFVNDYAFLKTATTAENAYVCSYAPMLLVELTTSQIQTLAADADVETLYYSPPVESQTAMDNSTKLIRAKGGANASTADYCDKTGDGIKIGMVEAVGVPDTTYLPDDQVTIDPEWVGEEDNHATAVAEIMLSNGIYEGIAPNAELYCTVAQYMSIPFYEAMEWLIVNGVNVINLSMGNDFQAGKYTYHEEWVDHIAINHSIHVVVASGNEGILNSDDSLKTPGKVIHPALAYNVITVGNLNDQNTLEHLLSQELRWTSSFEEVVNSDNLLPANKPDLVAPGTLIETSSFPTAKYGNTDIIGTSFAAPHVAGVIAQLLEQYPALKTQQDTIKAILTASVRHKFRRYDSNDNTEFDIYGAGLIDAKSSSNTIKHGNFINSSFEPGASINTKKTYTFSVTGADEIKRVSLTWLKHNRFANDNSHNEEISEDTSNTVAVLANLDMVIIAPDGTRLTYNGASSDNLVIAEFDPDDYGTGTYTVEIYIRNTTTARTYFSICWW
ncbi:MAG: S8 family serine peptidase [Clostridia bacterium]|nr:S8 family serine peptidase [Clostridia bacterium]